MQKVDPVTSWNEFVFETKKAVTPLLENLGFSIDDVQPHVGGERYLMQAVTTESGRKLILLGKRASDQKRVVMKVTNDPKGQTELAKERERRALLNTIRFAYQVFDAPSEFYFGVIGGYCISIQEFITQEKTFLERPIEEQFALALRAFKAQEGVHATTYGHQRSITRFFGTYTASTYLSQFQTFQERISSATTHPKLAPLLSRAGTILESHKRVIEQYCGFLTHTDFVPHNFRISGNTIFLLDHSSIRFGNKYEGWARFLNFMTLYNPALEKALVQYVKDNRTPEESLALYAMRMYRLGEIIAYYCSSIEKSTGDLRTLNTARVQFWSEVLEAIIDKRELAESVRSEYMMTRDNLRSDDEKKRQIGLH